jgi:hypothetical protein
LVILAMDPGGTGFSLCLLEGGGTQAEACATEEKFSALQVDHDGRLLNRLLDSGDDSAAAHL